MRKLADLVCLAISLAAVTAASAANLSVRITEPRDGAMVIGDVEVAAYVWGTDTVEGVEFRVDGRTVGLVASPPYRMRLDLGVDNVAHLLEVIAWTTDGGQAHDSVTTQPVPVSGEIDVDLRQLYVTATGGIGRVLDLRPEEFQILDEGTQQRLVTFELGDVPLTAALLIDSSSSMAGDKLRAAIQGAVAFVENMEQLDETEVVFFNDHLLSTTRFSGAGAVDPARFATTRAAGGTALIDALYVSLKLLEQRQGRRVIVLLSDGLDAHSTLRMRAVADFARRCRAQIHWIQLRRSGEVEADGDTTQMQSTWRSDSEIRDQLKLLRRTVTRSGGDIHPVDKIEQIEGVFLEILSDLRAQYVLGYYPSNRRKDGAWHKVQVRVARPGVRVRVAEGYVDD